ncbi:MAG: hypothetical protein GY934_09785 [Gammaproteobacteria bacterium]|nr:hypothetical protein [Gammaproteobacteria bacterium]
MQARPVENIYVPNTVLPMEGKMYMNFRYTANGLDPLEWPSVMEYNGMYFQKTGYDRDTLIIHYKQIDNANLAVGVS